MADRPLRILLVDPQGKRRAVYSNALHLAGFDVTEAADGRVALTRALISPPDLVLLMDLGLPLIDGVALCQILRRDRETHSAAIVAVRDGGPVALFDRLRAAALDVPIVEAATPDALLRELRALLSKTPAADSSPSHHERLTRSHRRFMSTTPPRDPPPLTCPSCDRLLTYEHSQIGGVNARNPEQWDYFRCPTCGVFQFRQRTRHMRRVADADAPFARQTTND